MALLLGWFERPALLLTYVALLVTGLLALLIAIWTRATTLSAHGELLAVIIDAVGYAEAVVYIIARHTKPNRADALQWFDLKRLHR